MKKVFDRCKICKKIIVEGEDYCKDCEEEADYIQTESEWQDK